MQVYPLTPYTQIQSENFRDEIKLVLRASDFKDVKFQPGTITITLADCFFRALEIENDEAIDFPEISIQFISCGIASLNIQKIVSTNISVSFGDCILKGIIASTNLLRISTNNCLLFSPFFLSGIKSLRISYSEDNIYPDRWQRLLKRSGLEIDQLLDLKQSYQIHDCHEIIYEFQESSEEKKGEYQTHHPIFSPERKGYRPNETERKRLHVSLGIVYTVGAEHKFTKIINARLSALEMKGHCTGEVRIENSRIDNWYIREFSAIAGGVFYNIRPFRIEEPERKLEIHTSNLDQVLFDNVSFDSYTILSFYRNNFGQVSFISCDFPNSYKEFDKFKTVENIHYPEVLPANYFKTRYATFLELKKRIEASGNYFEAQKFQSVSKEALRHVKELPTADKMILFINSRSNNHGLSIKRPLFGFFLFSIPIYMIYLWTVGRIFNSGEVDWNLFGYYFSFIDITHRSDFLVDRTELTGLSLFWDYLNKLIIGFFIYQFVAAFRKYGKG